MVGLRLRSRFTSPWPACTGSDVRRAEPVGRIGAVSSRHNVGGFHDILALDGFGSLLRRASLEVLPPPIEWRRRRCSYGSPDGQLLTKVCRHSSPLSPPKRARRHDLVTPLPSDTAHTVWL